MIFLLTERWSLSESLGKDFFSGSSLSQWHNKYSFNPTKQFVNAVSAWGLVTCIYGALFKLLTPNFLDWSYSRYIWVAKSWSLRERISIVVWVDVFHASDIVADKSLWMTIKILLFGLIFLIVKSAWSFSISILNRQSLILIGTAFLPAITSEWLVNLVLVFLQKKERRHRWQ